MKRFILALLLLVLFSGRALAFPNEPSGFRGIEWGSILSQYVKPNQGYYVTVNSLEAKEHYPEKVFYNPSDTRQLGNAKISELLYYSYQRDEKAPPIFSRVSMYFVNKDNTEPLEKFLYDNFGNPTKDVKHIGDRNGLGVWDIATWQGDITTLELQILRPREDGRYYATLWIISTKLIDEIESRRPKAKALVFNNGL